MFTTVNNTKFNLNQIKKLSYLCSYRKCKDKAKQEIQLIRSNEHQKILQFPTGG